MGIAAPILFILGTGVLFGAGIELGRVLIAFALYGFRLRP